VPQSLYARAIEGYQWGIVSPAAIARLSDREKLHDVVSELEQEGIHFGQFVSSTFVNRAETDGTTANLEIIVKAYCEKTSKSSQGALTNTCRMP